MAITMEFIVGESPSPDLKLIRYEKRSFPKFESFWTGALGPLTGPIEENAYAVVLSNSSDRDLTALRFEWIVTEVDGERRPRTVSSDSYMVDAYRAVLSPGDRMLICPSTSIRESVIDHVLAGGGTLGSGSHGRPIPPDAISIEFRIDLLLFADGELCGPDTARYAAELHCRNSAAAFVAKQVRAAEAENRDVTPVLNALIEMPRTREDHIAASIRRLASRYLRTMHNETMRTATLRYLENQPAVPTFYRRD